MPPPPDRTRPDIVGPEDGPQSPFPIHLSGPIIKGFGRGSKELGIPTANIPLDGLSVGGNSELESGIYYGWAGLKLSSTQETSKPAVSAEIKEAHAHTEALVGEAEPVATAKAAVYPMVMSLGYNPFYKNTVRSVEVHIMHTFPHDFYDSHLNLSILGFIRPEYDYVSKELLIQDIKTDIEVAARSLARPAYTKQKEDPPLAQFPA